MERFVIYLRTALFTLPKDGHVPVKALIIEGNVHDLDSSGGPTIKATKFLDEQGRMLSETPVTLIVPWSKIDHIHVP
jgi:hypothetical protein